MTYNEIKRRLIKCEKTLALFQQKDLSNSTPEERQQAQKNIISVNESISKYKKILKEGSKTYILTPKSGQTSAASLSDDEVDALKDADDIKGIKSADGEEIKERLKKNAGVEFSVEETKSIAKQVGKAVAMSLKAIGDAVRTMRATHIEENSFDVEVDYKNGKDDAFSFHIVDDTLHLADFSFDKELVDVGVKPSGEAIINVDVLSNELQKHFKSFSENFQYKDRKLSHEEEDRLDLIAHKEFGNDFSKLSDEDKDKVFAKRSKVGVKEDDNQGYTKHKLLAYLGQADDAMIRTHDDKYLIIYNPKNGNDDNAAMWHDETVFGVDNDGEEHEVRYDQIDRLQLEKHDPDQEQKDDEEDHGVGYDDEGRPLGEGEGDDHHYLKVPSADYKKAQAILDQNIDPTYVKMEVVDNDGAGNVIFYFIFKHEDGFDDMYGDAEADSEFYQEPEEDGGAFVYDAAMDLRANDITVVDSSADMDEATDLNDPVLMRMRVAKKRNADLKKVDQMHARDRKDQRINGKKRLLIKQLKDKRAEIEREMENDPEIETTGGPVADRYGDMLNKIDNAIEKASGRIKPMDYDTAVGKVSEDEEEDARNDADYEAGWADDPRKDEVLDNGTLVTFGYDLDMIQQVVDHLKNNYKEDQDYVLHVGRGDDLPNAVTFPRGEFTDDHDLNDMLNAAQDDQDKYDAYTDESHQHPSKGHRGGAKKIQKAYDLVITMMKDLAKKYKAGDKSVVDQLKTLTITKKKLEKQLDNAVSGTNMGQDLDEKNINEYASRDLDEIFGALGYRQGFDEFIEDNPGCVEVIMEWIGSVSEFRQKLSSEYSKEEQENLGFYYGDDDDDEYNESTNESLNPEVSKKVAQFIKAMAKRYDYEEQDAVYAIMAALKQRDFDGVNEEEYKGKHQGTNYKWPMSKATKDRKEADKKETLKEFTDNSFKGSEVIDDANKRAPDMFGKQLFADLLPKGVASENDAFEALKKHDKSGIKARMGRYAPMFVHMQYHVLEHEGDKYRMHQKQYYNSNFKDKDPDFNPGVSAITLMKVDENDEGKNLGTILVKTDQYVQDLRNLPGLGKRHMEEATRKDLGMVTSVSKRRAGAELKQKLAGKRSDGMGKYDGNIYGLDNDGKRVELKSLNDLNKFKKFELDADINEVNEASKERMIKQIKRALKDGLSIYKLPMDAQKYYTHHKDEFKKEAKNEAKGGQIMPGDYVKNQHGNIYQRVDGKVGKHDAYVRVTNGKVGKKKTGLHDSFKLTLVNKSELEEAGPGFAHDCAAHVVHEVYGAGICLDEQHTLVKEGNKHVVTHYDVFFKKGNRLVEDVPAEHLKVITMNEHWHKGYKKKKK